jgi:hypothetical protein
MIAKAGAGMLAQTKMISNKLFQMILLYSSKLINEGNMKIIKKYHIKKGFPSSIVLPRDKYLLDYSMHAKKEAKNDVYRPEKLALPTFIDFANCFIFEIETENDLLNKVLCRCQYNEILDLVLCITINGYFVNTVWFNLRGDTHDNIDLSKYNRPRW